VTLGNDNATDGQTDGRTDGQTECDALCGPLYREEGRIISGEDIDSLSFCFSASQSRFSALTRFLYDGFFSSVNSDCVCAPQTLVLFTNYFLSGELRRLNNNNDNSTRK